MCLWRHIAIMKSDASSPDTYTCIKIKYRDCLFLSLKWALYSMIFVFVIFHSISHFKICPITYSKQIHPLFSCPGLSSASCFKSLLELELNHILHLPPVLFSFLFSFSAYPLSIQIYTAAWSRDDDGRPEICKRVRRKIQDQSDHQMECRNVRRNSKQARTPTAHLNEFNSPLWLG